MYTKYLCSSVQKSNTKKNCSKANVRYFHKVILRFKEKVIRVTKYGILCITICACLIITVMHTSVDGIMFV